MTDLAVCLCTRIDQIQPTAQLLILDSEKLYPFALTMTELHLTRIWIISEFSSLQKMVIGPAISIQEPRNWIPHTFENIAEWQKIVKELCSAFPGLLIIDFVDLDYYKDYQPLKCPWIGFVHYSLDPKLRNSLATLQNPNFRDSLSHCKGLFAFSSQLAKEWTFGLKELNTDFKVEWLPHPLVDSQIKIEPCKLSKDLLLLQVGYFYRNLQKFIDFKPLLRPGETLHKSLLLKHQLSKQKSEFHDMSNIEIIPFQSSLEYYSLLKKSIVFSYYDYLAGSTLLIECIIHNIPIIINKSQTSIEYLGADYPLFYEDLFELSLSQVEKTRLYLSEMTKDQFQVSSFISEISKIVK